jgi:hypothetical protein
MITQEQRTDRKGEEKRTNRTTQTALCFSKKTGGIMAII